MAYVEQSVIDDVRAELKALNKKYGMKATASGKGTLKLTITISSGPLDFLSQIKSYNEAQNHGYRGQPVYAQYWQKLSGQRFNHYHDEDKYTGKEQEYLKEIKRIVYKHHWDDSDVMTDYFSCAYYIHIQFGKWNKAYKCTKKELSMQEPSAKSQTDILDVGVLTQAEACVIAHLLKLGYFSFRDSEVDIVAFFKQAGLIIKIEGTRTLCNHVKVEDVIRKIHYRSFDKYLKDEDIVLSPLLYNACKEIWLAAKMT